ncbi:hypothetical protein F-liban_72 [Faustovirus]|nr:hypothetical protein F-liban_72 [Faustovirus]
MEKCVIPIELWHGIAKFDASIALALRKCCRFMSMISLPSMINLPNYEGKTRHLLFAQRGLYKLRQYYVDGQLHELKATDGVVTKTTYVLHCLSNPLSDKAPRYTTKVTIPRDNRIRKRIWGNNIITDYYITNLSVPNNTLATPYRVTVKTLVHVTSLLTKNQTYKIWFGDHYKVFEFDDSWNIIRDVYNEGWVRVGINCVKNI